MRVRFVFSVCLRVYSLGFCLRACLYVHACVRACERAYERACVRACVRASMRVSMRACVHACLRPCVPVSVHACAFVRASVRVFVRVCNLNTINSLFLTAQGCTDGGEIASRNRDVCQRVMRASLLNDFCRRGILKFKIEENYFSRRVLD